MATVAETKPVRWTPGPWGISYGFDINAIGHRATYVAGPDPAQIGIKLATPWVEGAWDGDEEAAANAVLISAAPELYDALSLLLEVATSAIEAGDWKVDGACDPGRRIEFATRTLAKARGEQVSA